jgi:hypothetical protein
MTFLEDTLTDEKLEEVEKAKTKAKREKTKYGSLLNDD